MSVEFSAESLSIIEDYDPAVARTIERWNIELQSEFFLKKLQYLLNQVDDRRDWAGREGDEACRVHMALQNEIGLTNIEVPRRSHE